MNARPTELHRSFEPEALEPRQMFNHAPAFFNVANLTSDGNVPAAHTDPNLKNAWGIAFNTAMDVVWVADNGSGVSTVYNTDGTATNTGGLYTAVTIPPPQGAAGASAPTGEIFNSTGSFVVAEGGRSGAAAYVWSTEDGTISAWNPSVDANNAILEVDRSASGAVYKGLATASVGGKPMLYATDFHNGRVDVFDSSFHAISFKRQFQDPQIPAGFAPFGIQNVNGDVVVTYAKQNAAKHDDVAGAGNGFVDVFTAKGKLVAHLAGGGALNSPWGLAMAPSGFGRVGGDLLVGNFGDGRVLAFNFSSGHFDGTLLGSNGKPMVIDGLWGLTFGPTKADANTLFFTAGPNGEADGLFGVIASGKGRHH